LSGQITFASPLSDYRDAMGPVLLWKFPAVPTGIIDLPVVGTPWTSGHDPKAFTHFSPIPIPRLEPTR
jgi:hypothetical protein